MALPWVFCIWLGSNTCLSSQFSQIRPFHPFCLLPLPSPEATIASGFGVMQWLTPYKELPEMSEGPFFSLCFIAIHFFQMVVVLVLCVCVSLFVPSSSCVFLKSLIWNTPTSPVLSLYPTHLNSFPDGIQKWASKTQNTLLSSTPWESFIVLRCYLCLRCAICSGIHLLSSASNNSVLAGEGSVGLMHRKTWGKALFSSLKLIVVLRGLNC